MTYLFTMVLALLASPVSAGDYATYCNERFDFCIDYPSHFGMEPLPHNGDGRKFYDHRGFRMTVGGINNVLGINVASEMQSWNNYFDIITYQKHDAHWYVLSGYNGDDILYVKSFLGRQSINTLYIRYPKSLKADYGAVITHIEKSFRPGNLNQPH